MKNLKSNFILKFIAVVLLCASVTAFAFSSVCIAYGVASGAFNDNALKREEARRNAIENHLHVVTNNIVGRFYIAEKGDYKTADFPETDNDNIMYEVKNEDGAVIYSTVDGSKVQTIHEQEYTRHWQAVYAEPETESETSEYETETTEYHTDPHWGNESIYPVESTTERVILEPEKRENFYFTVYLKEDITEKDGFYTIGAFFDFVAKNKTNFYTVAIASLIVSILAFVFLMCAAGHKSGEDEIHISRFDKFPIDILTVIFGGAILVFGSVPFALIEKTIYQAEHLRGYNAFDVHTLFTLTVISSFIFALLAVLLLTVFSMTVAVRLKTKTFVKTTVIGKFVKLICKWIKNIFKFFFRTAKKVPLVWKTVLITAVIAVIFFVLFAGAYTEEFFVVFGILFTMACCIVIILVSVMLKTIKKGTEEIVNGNTGKKIDTKYMIGDVKKHAENINSINDGIAKAVEQRMKSERFKTELITNVSHDIKTPLTSIINYVDLLEKEDIDNEKAEEYIEVLSRQSSRLKKLIEDLIEASKASTGNLAVNMSKFEIGILLTQALGEYEEKFKKADLEVVLNKPEDMLFVMADSRHMWRIFDNVFNNITKYAMPHTRVYIDVKRFGRNVEVYFKNISKEQLNITGEELMERFVRGDSSRNTEGSGLGLSIAKNLAQLQNGSFNIQIDGDLFKIKLALPLSE